MVNKNIDNQQTKENECKKEKNRIIINTIQLSKNFPGVKAVDNLDFSLLEGEIHGLIGENGAGKSTFIKMLTGAYKPDNGYIVFFDKKIQLGDPFYTRGLGIIAIFQEPYIFPNFTVGENIFIGRENKKKIMLQSDKENENAKILLDSLGFSINPILKASSLSLAEQRMLEIAKAASIQSKVVILDEPTASLADSEIKVLFSLLYKLKSKKVSIIYISHRLEEVLEITDRITVLRDGVKVATVNKNDVAKEDLVEMMVGRKLHDMYPKYNVKIGEKILSVEKLNRLKEFHDVSFNLYKGEILGIAGLMGSGRTELAKALFGATIPTEGEIYLDNKKVNFKKPSDAIKAGIGFLTEDRKNLGLFLNQDVKSNTSILILSELTKLGLIQFSQEKIIVNNLVDKLRIITPNINVKVLDLSGGNQQKVVLARWLAKKVKVLILDEPTHGIDVGAKVEIYQLLGELTKEGIGIILISSEFQELLAITDRILVMYRGSIKKEFNTKNTNQEELLKCVFGLNSAEKDKL
jgi:ribose transport system ATP-binding protein